MATISTIKSSGGDFTSLQAWENWADGQATADQWAECYSGFDMGPVTVQSWSSTPSESVYPKIYAADGHKHDGTATLNGAYISLTSTLTSIAAISVNYIRIDGIRIDLNNASYNNNYGIYISDSIGSIIDSCIVVHTASAAGDFWGFYIRSYSTNIITTVRNCIYINTVSPIASKIGFRVSGITSTGTRVATVYLFNNTCYNEEKGFVYYADAVFSGSATLNLYSTNNVSIGATSGDFSSSADSGGTVNVTQTYCCSDDATADDWGGSGNQINKTAANCFNNPGTNVIPKINGDIFDAGVNIGSFYYDAIGTHRPLGPVWDIGAIETSFNGEYSKTESTHNNYPIYKNNSEIYLFYGEDSGNYYWVLNDSIVDDLSEWAFYSDANKTYPLNDGNVWNAGNGTTPGYIYDNPQSSSTSSEMYSESSSSSSIDSSSSTSYDPLEWVARTPGLFESASTTYISVCVLNESQVLVCYEDIDNSNYGTAQVLSISGSSVSANTPAVFNSATTSYISVCALSSTKALVTYRDGGNSNYGTAQVLDISGSLISTNTPFVFESNSTTYTSVCALSSTKALVCYAYSGAQAQVLDISGSTVSGNTLEEFETATTSYISVCALSSSQVLACYRNGSISTVGKAQVLDISGGSVSSNTPYTFNNASSTYVSVCALSSTKALVSYSYFGGKVQVLNISGSTVSGNTAVTYESSSVNYTSICALDSTEALVCYNLGKFVPLHILGNSITTNTPIVFENATSNYVSVCSINDIKALVCYQDDGNSDYGTYCLLEGTDAGLSTSSSSEV